MQDCSDSLLVKKIKLGNKKAFDSLFFKYYQPLMRFAFHLCNDSLIAEDAVQKTFIKIWQNHNEIPAEDAIKLLFTYTKNTVIDEIRKMNTRRKHEGKVVSEIIVNDSEYDDKKYQIKAIIETAIEKLPRKAKEIFRLAKKEGLSIKEIAKHLDISTKTVENQLTIAYKKLRNNLEPYKKHLNY